MSVPISIGMLSTFLFQVIDTYFVGQLGANQLAALSFASTVYFLLVGLFIGLTTAVAIIIGNAFGANNMDKVKSTTALSLLLTLVLSSLLSVSGIFTIESFFRLLGADENILPFIREYMFTLYCGMPLLMISLMGGGALRATGVVKPPEIFMGIGGVINLILDYLLIFGKGPFPAMGIKGAALATVLSWSFVIVAILFMTFKSRLLNLSFLKERIQNVEILKDIYILGPPSMLTQLIGPATLMYITYLLAQQAATAVAAYGVAGRIETLLLIGILGVSIAATPFIAQNLGAEKHLRIDEAIVFGGKASFYLGILLFILLMLFIKPTASIFSDSQQVIDYTSLYFYAVSISYVFYGLYIITSSIFNGLQLPVNSLKIVLVKCLVFTVPLTLFGSMFGVLDIFVGLSASNIIGGIYAAKEMRNQLRKVNSSLAKQNPISGYKEDLWALKHMLTSIFK